MYHQDWLMRQIEIIAETLARVVFRKAPARRAEVILQQKKRCAGRGTHGNAAGHGPRGRAVRGGGSAL